MRAWLAVMFAFFSTASLFALDLRLPEQLEQGSAYFIECPDAKASWSLQFVYADKKKSPLFPIIMYNIGASMQSGGRASFVYPVFLVGIDPLAAPGEAQIFILDQAGVNIVSAVLTIQPRKWEREDIYLDAALTAMVQTPDPVKTEQAKRYQEILSTVDRKSVFLFAPLQLPVRKPRITSEFGSQRRYVYSNKSTSLSYHAGLDYGKEQDNTILACGDGRVVLAENRIVSGNTVIIEHLPGLYSIYMHMKFLSVQVGDRVKQGFVLGEMGQTGLATGMHLHWEVRVCNVAVDPMSLVHIDFFSKLHTIIPAQEGGDFN